jgi:hypothetical protein
MLLQASGSGARHAYRFGTDVRLAECVGGLSDNVTGASPNLDHLSSCQMGAQGERGVSSSRSSGPHVRAPQTATPYRK